MPTVTLSVEPTSSAPALTLRPWRHDDAPDLVTAHRDPLLRRWLVHHLDDEAQALGWIDAQSEGRSAGTRLSFAVLENTAPGEPPARPLGHIALKRTGTPDSPSAEVGYWTSAAARGRGIAPRALAAVSDWALGPHSTLPVTRLELLHSVPNEPSCRVAEKCGYALEAVLAPLPPAYPHKGHLHARLR
ncbi:GNAT family N-acetyltransferase [Streptomyces sp. NBC_00237]|uniref:GNAT family N-acetyltransferase n=1 Tax=Streptomyces sp. NBC_00237 TaxID=2975687 RepID=UPI002259A89B|nr:GNAT family N-acetyltransferase [Streptomyces sp. NBC_00237]MCX5205262.1 GNAT family N-acetyltransferase [Streptomyces sp. NBC_00237]